MSRQDDGGLASGVAEGLDFRDILEVELAGIDNDKIFVLTLEIQRWHRSFQSPQPPKRGGKESLAGLLREAEEGERRMLWGVKGS